MVRRLGQADREGQEETGKDKLRRNKAMKKAIVCWMVGILVGFNGKQSLTNLSIRDNYNI
jgi:hypothetical protein